MRKVASGEYLLHRKLTLDSLTNQRSEVESGQKSNDASLLSITQCDS